MASNELEIPVSGHVYSTRAPFANWNNLNYDPALEKLNDKHEYQIYGFEWSEKRVRSDYRDPTKITVRMDQLTPTELLDRKLLNVEYKTAPSCGKAEYEEWRKGYIVF